jgi:hypothetical protein
MRAYMRRAHAPPEAEAGIDFLHGIAFWDFAEASRAAAPLIGAAQRGSQWLPGDLLRDGATVARLRIGDVAGARDAFARLARYSRRRASDLRTRLLAARVAERASP